MIGLLCFVLAVLVSPFKKLRLEAENAVLRHQSIVLRRRPHGRVRFTNHDRLLFIQLYRWFPSILEILHNHPARDLVRWHKAGFRCYWRWKSGPLGGRPQIETELRELIRRMSIENPLWGAPRIHGELLKLGFEIAQSSVAKYMVKRGGPPSQGWRTFLHNHAPGQDEFKHPVEGVHLPASRVAKMIDANRFHDVLWKIIRGLHYHHTREILPPNWSHTYTVTPPFEVPPEFFRAYAERNRGVVRGKYP